MIFGKLFKIAKDFVVTNNNTLLVVTSLTGLVITGVTSYKAAKRVSKALEEAYDQKVEEALKTAPEGLTEPVEGLTVKEKVVVAGKHVIPPILSGVTTAICIVSNDRIHKKRYALLAGVCSAMQKVALDNEEILHKFEEVLGTEDYRKIRQQVSADRVKKLTDGDIPENRGLHFTMIRDELTGSTWWGSVDEVNDAICKYQKQCSEGYNVPYSSFLYEAGAKNMDYGKASHWFYYGPNANGNILLPELSTKASYFYVDGEKRYCTQITHVYEPLVEM